MRRYVKSETISDMICENMKQGKGVLIVMVGLPGSGKSTIAESFKKDYPCTIVSTDEIRREICDGNIQDMSKNEEVFRIYHSRINTLLKERKFVVADATNLTMKSRRAILNNIQNIDCFKVAFVVSKDYETCVYDNNRRDVSVPLTVMDKMLKSFQIPFMEEGFDIVHVYHTKYTQYLDKYMGGDNMFNRAVKDCVGYNQNNPHHTHLLDEHQNLVTEKFNQWIQSREDVSPKDKLVYVFGAKFHDLGKPYCRINNEDGTSSYNNHANVGAYFALTSGLLFEMDSIFLINYHMLPFYWENESTHNKYKKIFGEYKYNVLVNFNRIDKECC